MKGIYINELMRRIDRSGTLDVTSGTVHGFPVYTDDDPVVEFNKKKNDYEIAGKEWDAEYDCEYLREAIKGWGKRIYFLKSSLKFLFVYKLNYSQTCFSDHLY